MKPTLLFAALFALAPIAMAQTQTLTTVNTAGTLFTLNGWAGSNGMFFDINVTSPNGIIVSQIDHDLVAGSGTMDVYVTGVGLTFLPVLSNAAAWTKVGTATMSTAASGMTTGLLTQPFFLAPGTYGVALHFINLQARYKGPNTTSTLPLVYSDANLTIDCNQARMRNTPLTDPFSGATSASPRVPITNITYTTNLQTVNFTADVTRGATPLTVQFTDASFSGVPGGIIAWAWDFNGDNVVDSSLQNPTFTYTTCGDYSVSLTIVDGSGAYTEVKNNFIQTDLLTADFAWQLTAPHAIQFTDTTTPTPATWAWDLDGDTVVDSTVQNPTFVYPTTTTETTITLTVQLACRAPVTITRRIVVSQALETTFQGGLVTTTTALGGANMFDLTVINPGGVVINAMHVNSNVNNGLPLTVNVWVSPLTYLTNQTVPAVWRMVATSATVSRGGGGRTLVTFPNGIYLPPGTYGMAVEQLGASPVYTNMGGNRTFSNADLRIDAGLTMESPVFGAGSVFLSRIWNGVVYYSTSNIAQDAGYTFFGLGCPGALGVTTNTSNAAPRLNSTMTVTLDNLTLGVGFYMIGFSKTNSLFGPLPLDLTLFGASGCSARVSNDATLLVIGAGSTASLNLPFPNVPTLLGMRFYTQAFVVDNVVNALGLVTSDAAAAQVGR